MKDFIKSLAELYIEGLGVVFVFFLIVATFAGFLGIAYWVINFT
jgi:Na+-transporting methylmalonyl-CoA/oxaloacetate decarboxylase gamma subunit